jgi:hypothetical protein
MTRETLRAEIDWIEVPREGYELEQRHGRNAHMVAAKLADKAEAAGDAKAAQFWRAVSSSIAPRG